MCLIYTDPNILFTINSVCLVVLSTSLNAANTTTSAPNHSKTHHHEHATPEPQNSTTPHQEHNGTTIVRTPPPTMSPLEIKQKLEDLCIVPDVIPVAPEQKLDVWFGLETAQMGNIVHENVVSNEPILLMWRWNPGEYFTVIATGPDVPSAQLPTDAEWRHWIVINIPGNEVNKGQIIRDYIGFGNETEIGFHRMVFLVFKQPTPFIKSPEALLRNSDSAYRGFFSIRNFVRKHNLGLPVAANFVVVNCTNIIHDPVAWATMMKTTTPMITTSQTKTTNESTTQGYEWTAYAEEVTEDKK